MIDVAAIVIPMSFVLGAVVGSFLNVVIYRVPRGMSVARPARSFCPNCQRPIRWYENVPILSWLFLNGRCAGCRNRIGAVYPLVELLTALLFLGLAWTRFGGGGEPVPANSVRLVLDFTLCGLLVAIAVIDFRHALIPDPLTIPWIPLFVAAAGFDPAAVRGHGLDPALHDGPAGAAALAFAGLFCGVFPALFVDFWRREREVVDPGEAPESALPTADETFHPGAELRELALPVLLPGLAGAALFVLAGSRIDLVADPRLSAAITSAAGAGFGLFFIFTVRLIFSVLFRREAMGLGDAKFLALAGAVFGAEGALVVFLLSSVLGALPAFAGLLRRMPIPTGLLLAAALAPLVLAEPVARATGSPGSALLMLLPVPVLALVLFLRRLRRSTIELTAMPFGPFLVVGALLLLLALEPMRRLPILDQLLASIR